MATTVDRSDATAPVKRTALTKVTTPTDRKDTSGGAGNLPSVRKVKRKMEHTFTPGRHSTFREEPNRTLNDDGKLNKEAELPKYRPHKNVSLDAQAHLLIRGSLWRTAYNCHLQDSQEPPELRPGGTEVPENAPVVFLGSQRGDYKDDRDRRIRAPQHLFLVAGKRCVIKNFDVVRPVLDDDDDDED